MVVADVVLLNNLAKLKEIVIIMFCCFGDQNNILCDSFYFVCKGAVCSSADKLLDLYQLIFLRLNKLNKQTDPKGATQFHTVLLCLYVADPATFLISNSVRTTEIYIPEFISSPHKNYTYPNSVFEFLHENYIALLLTHVLVPA